MALETGHGIGDCVRSSEDKLLCRSTDVQRWLTPPTADHTSGSRGLRRSRRPASIDRPVLQHAAIGNIGDQSSQIVNVTGKVKNDQFSA